MPEWNEVAETFVNPYNFVSLGNIKREEPAEDLTNGNLTGVIKCTLKTITPLVIPDSADKRLDSTVQEEHYIYPFFKVGNKAVVPGSEIRGMIRSVYEAATNSCMSVVNTNILSARHSFPRQPGLIRYNDVSGNWELNKAQKYMLNTTRTQRNGTFYRIDKTSGKWHIADGGNAFYTGSKVKFTPGGAYTKLIRGTTINIGTVVDRLGGTSDGYLLLWEDIGGKHHNSIFQLAPTPTSTLVPCVNLNKAIENFHEICKIYENNDEKYKKVTYEIKKDGNYYPVWYEIVSQGTDNYVYLSPACISRSVFDKRLEDLLGNHKKCTNIPATDKCSAKFELCPACRLFGMIGEKSLGSSLRFSDAILKENENNVFLGYKTLKTLANPKISAVEFYTKRPGDDALTWSYDYKTTNYTGNGANLRPVRELTDIKIRGRKFYFHDLRVNSDESKYTERAKKEYNSTIELVKKDVSFVFDVYFENITDTQLKNLVWVLTFGENKLDEDMCLCHKLGHGKPLGLGSVKIKVDEINTRKVETKDNDVTFTKKPENADALLHSCKIDAPDELLKIANINFTDGSNVSYPLADDNRRTINSQAAHQWFIGNKLMGTLPPDEQRAKYPKYSIKYVLPSISKIKDAQHMLLHKHELIDPDDLRVWSGEPTIEPETSGSKITIIDSTQTVEQIQPQFDKKKIEEAIKKLKSNPYAGKIYKDTLKSFINEAPESEWADLLEKAKGIKL